VPSVQAMSVNEWPEPATFTRRAPATTSASSASPAGVAIRSGAQRWSRVQFLQMRRAKVARKASGGR